jgi:hypothetical protein
MTKEISDSLEIKGKAVLHIGAQRTGGIHYLDGCHAKITNSLSFLPSDFPTQIGIAAVQAGYKIGEEFEYKITIIKK